MVLVAEFLIFEIRVVTELTFPLAIVIIVLAIADKICFFSLYISFVFDH